MGNASAVGTVMRVDSSRPLVLGLRPAESALKASSWRTPERMGASTRATAASLALYPRTGLYRLVTARQPRKGENKKRNKLAHTAHGNTGEGASAPLAPDATPADEPEGRLPMVTPAPPPLLFSGQNVSGWAFTCGVQAWQERWLTEYIQRERPAALALVELSGGRKARARAKAFFSGHGYEVEGILPPSKRLGSSHDAQGGVLVAFDRRHFKWQSHSRGDNIRVIRPLSEEAIHEAADSIGVDPGAEDVMAVLAAAGTRVAFLPLQHARGGLAGKAMYLATMYVPASFSPARKAIFLRAAARGIQQLVPEGAHWIMYTDCNCVMGPEFLSVRRELHAADAALRQCFGGGDASVAVHVRYPEAAWSHFPPNGSPRTIDYVLVSHTLAQWVSARAHRHPSLPSTTSEQGGEVDRLSHGDHTTMEADIAHAYVQKLGVQRAARLSLRGPQRADYIQRAMHHPGHNDASPAASLEDIESFLAHTANCLMADTGVTDHTIPNDEYSTRLAYLRGMLRVVTARWHDRTFFDHTRASGLFAAGLLDRARIRFVRFRRMRGLDTSWQQVRGEVRLTLENAIGRIVSRVHHIRQQTLEAHRVGQADPADVQSHRARLNALHKECKLRKRGPSSGVSSILDPDNGLATSSAPRIHQLLETHGRLTNTVQPPPDAPFLAWLQVCVPRQPEIRTARGDGWVLRGVFSYQVFLALRKRGTGKAPGLHPFSVDHLAALPDDHPALRRYHEALLCAMEAGDFPEYFANLMVTLIPKKYGSALDTKALRDIWLGQHGMKLVQRTLQELAISPLLDRVSTAAGGGIPGRTGTSLSFSLHTLIEQRRRLRLPLRLMFVDLSKCFMTFSRSHGMSAATYYGLPSEARRAWCALYSRITGRFETVYGSTEEFQVLRGLLQGAVDSPALCVLLMDTLVQVLELKVVGAEWWGMHGEVEHLNTLVFIDDAASATATDPMLQRVAFFWEIWAAIMGAEIKILGFDKTVVAGVDWIVDACGRVRPSNPRLCIWLNGQRVPCLPYNKIYTYLGLPTRLDGLHARVEIPAKLREKRNVFNNTALLSRRHRQHSVQLANAHTYGVDFFIGSVWCVLPEAADDLFGASQRGILRRGRVSGRKRCPHAPRLSAHAPPKALPEPVNDPLRLRHHAQHRDVVRICGRGLQADGPALAAASVSTFVYAWTSPVDSPDRRAAHSELASIAYTCGCRGDPLFYPLAAFASVIFPLGPVGRAIVMLMRVTGLRDVGLRWYDEEQATWSPCHYSWFQGYAHQGGALLEVAPSTFPSSIELGMLGVAEVAHLCTRDGSSFMQYDDFLRHNPESRWSDATGLRSHHAAVVGELVRRGICPVPWIRPVPPRDFLSCQPHISPTDDVTEPRRLARASHLADALQGDGGSTLSALLKSREGGDVRAFAEAAQRMMAFRAHPPPKYGRALAPSGLNRHTSTLRAVSWYSAKLPCIERDWLQRVGSGGSFSPMPSTADELEVRRLLGRWRIDPEGDGWIQGPRQEHLPLAVAFWRHCEDLLRDAGRSPNPEESSSMYARVVHLSVLHRATHLIATDGSKDKDEDETITVARAAIVFSREGPVHLAGKLERFNGDLERHSYDAELVAFLDVAHHLPPRARAILITDCLSAASAAVAFHRLSARKASNKHLARELDSLHSFEAQLDTMYYLWCHSHQGVTPNEAVDILAGNAISTEGAPYVDPPLTVSPTFAIGYVPGIKRSIGRTALEVFNLQQLQIFYGASHHSLFPSAVTWKFFARPRDKGSRLLTENICDICEDEQQDRLGLPWERTYISNAAHGRRSLPSFLRGISACLVCGSPAERSSRWHMKFGCPGVNGELKAKRERIALWIAANAQRLNSRQSSVVLDAVSKHGSHYSRMHTGLPDDARCAIDAACGLPWTPDDGGAAKSRSFARLYAQQVVLPWTEITTLYMAALGKVLAPPCIPRGVQPQSLPAPRMSGFFTNDLWVPAPLADLVRQWKARRAARAWFLVLRDMIISRGPGSNSRSGEGDVQARALEVRRISCQRWQQPRQCCLHRKRARVGDGGREALQMVGSSDAEAVRQALRADARAEVAKAVSVTWAGTRWFTLLVLRSWRLEATRSRSDSAQRAASDLANFHSALRTCIYMRSRGFKVLNLGELAHIAKLQKVRERAERVAKRKAPSWNTDLSGNALLGGGGDALADDVTQRVTVDFAQPPLIVVLAPARHKRARRDGVSRGSHPAPRSKRRPPPHPATLQSAPKRSQARRRYEQWAQQTVALRRRLTEIRAKMRAHRARCSFQLNALRRKKRERERSSGEEHCSFPLATLSEGSKRQKSSFSVSCSHLDSVVRGSSMLDSLGIIRYSHRAAAIFSLAFSHAHWILQRSPSVNCEGHRASHIYSIM